VTTTTNIRLETATGHLLGARQLGEIVRRVAASPAEWITRVRLNPAGRWYEQIHLDASHEVWVISWLPGQETGFHDHGGASGAFSVVLGALQESRVPDPSTARVLAKPVGSGTTRSFGPRYIHNVRNAAKASLAVSVHAYSPPLSAMTRYELTSGGLMTLGTEAATAWQGAA
jgi:predicted metal-dependent enzyme (double-stranded beta helix superfamily)